MGKGNQGLEDFDTLMKEQNDAEKCDNNNLLNTLVDKLPVFSQSFIEETQKTPNKIDVIRNIIIIESILYASKINEIVRPVRKV